MIKFNEEEIMIFGMDATNSSYEDKTFKILGTDDERSFDDCYFHVSVSDNEISGIMVFNIEDDLEEDELPELSLEEEAHIKSIVNESIKATLEAQRESEGAL